MPRRILVALALALALELAFAGCATDDVETPVYDSGLFPRVAHSGFNTTVTFKVMFATSAPNPTWTVDDPSIASVAPSDAPTIPNVNTKGLAFALVTTLRAGETTVIMTSGSTVLTSDLQVKGYTDEQVTIGKSRYENADPNNDPARVPCAGCHQKPGGVDHSPLKMAGFDDPTILGVIENATYPANKTGQSTTSSYAPTGPLAYTMHKWNLTESEKDGILAHLRSLPLGGLQ